MTSEALAYFNGDELPSDVFLKKYALEGEKTPDDMHRRMAKEFARIERSKFKEPYSEDFIYDCFKNFGKIIPQGSIMFGLGNPNYVSLSNCFLLEKPLDSYSSIHSIDEQLTQISKRRGGVGIDISNLRPAGSPTSNSSKTSTGIVPFCERYSNSIREVGQGGRRAALMITLSVHHPEVVSFAEMKMDSKKVTGANVSIRLTDEFLKAAKDNRDYEQRFPVDSKTPSISIMVNAREVWNKIIHCAWLRAEPGLLFWDKIINESPADCYKDFGFESVGTNPCAELILCELDSCRLMILNTFSFVDNPFSKVSSFNFNEFKKYAKIMQRLMDDVVDLELECIDKIIDKINKDPEPMFVKSREFYLWGKIREKCSNGRRTGAGVTAIGDTVAALGIKYGSEESIKLVGDIYKTLKLGCYESSVDIAEERGAFPIWNSKLEINNPFLLRIKQEDKNLYERMQRVGRSNIALLTTAPCGSTSIMMGPSPYYGTSSGIEPLYTDIGYTRRKKINLEEGEVAYDFKDEMGDKWKHFEVFHAKLKMWMDITGETDYKKSPYYGATAEKIDWQARVRLQAAAGQHVDHSISATVNLPNSVTEEEVSKIYEEAWKSGLKGITVYRDGCRSGVLVSNDDANKNSRKDAVKRTPVLPCHIYHFKVKKEPFTVLVGVMGDLPYEVFAFKQDETNKIDPSVEEGFIHKIKRGKYELRDAEGVNLFDTDSLSCQLNDDEAAITRLVSTSLRHNACPLEFLIHQLEKASGTMDSLSKAISRGLKKYVANGSKVPGEKCYNCALENTLRRQEGCVSCVSCGWSKC